MLLCVIGTHWLNRVIHSFMRTYTLIYAFRVRTGAVGYLPFLCFCLLSVVVTLSALLELQGQWQGR